MYNVVLVGIKKNESKLMTSLLVYSVRTGSIILLNGVSERGKVEGDVCKQHYTSVGQRTFEKLHC